jgi:hypothetical protein
MQPSLSPKIFITYRMQHYFMSIHISYEAIAPNFRHILSWSPLWCWCWDSEQHFTASWLSMNIYHWELLQGDRVAKEEEGSCSFLFSDPLNVADSLVTSISWKHFLLGHGFPNFLNNKLHFPIDFNFWQSLIYQHLF